MCTEGVHSMTPKHYGVSLIVLPLQQNYELYSQDYVVQMKITGTYRKIRLTISYKLGSTLRETEIFRSCNGMIKTSGTTFGSSRKRFALGVSHYLISSPPAQQNIAPGVNIGSGVQKKSAKT